MDGDRRAELLELLKAVVGSRDGVIGATELGAFSAIAHSAYQQVKGGDAPSEAEALVVLQEVWRLSGAPPRRREGPGWQRRYRTCQDHLV